MIPANQRPAEAARPRHRVGAATEPRFGPGRTPGLEPDLRVGDSELPVQTIFGGQAGVPSERERAAGPKGGRCPAVLQPRVEPVERGRGEHEVRRAGLDRPVLEGQVQDPQGREAAQVAAAAAGRGPAQSTERTPRPRRASGDVAVPGPGPISSTRSPRRSRASLTRSSNNFGGSRGGPGRRARRCRRTSAGAAPAGSARAPPSPEPRPGSRRCRRRR